MLKMPQKTGQRGLKYSMANEIREINSEMIVNEIQEYLDKGVPYIDAIVDYAERNEVEIEVVGEIVRRSPLLKAKIYEEAEVLNMVEPEIRLPI